MRPGQQSPRKLQALAVGLTQPPGVNEAGATIAPEILQGMSSPQWRLLGFNEAGATIAPEIAADSKVGGEIDVLQ